LVFFNRGKSKACKGLYDEAILDYRKALDLEPAGSLFDQDPATSRFGGRGEALPGSQQPA
jgi:hypothetical protein